MYYIEENGKIVLFDDVKSNIEQTLVFIPEYQKLEIKETNRPIVDFEFADTEEYKEKKAKEEREHRNHEIDRKIKELNEMIVPYLINNDTKTIETYVNVINSLAECKF